MSKRNIHDHKVMLCIWWNQEGMVYYELLKWNETLTGARYQQQLCNLKRELDQNRPQIASKRQKMILLHDNAPPHAVVAVKQTLLELEWEDLPHPAYSPDSIRLSLFLINTRLKIYIFPISKKYKNLMMNGLLQKTNRSIVTIYISLARKMRKSCSKRRKIF